MRENYYEHRRRHKEIREKSRENTLQAAKQYLEWCFSENGYLTITTSRSGNERVRAYVPDEDGYAGYVSGTSFVGIAKIEHNNQTKYVAERHFPYVTETSTYLWEFTPETDELTVMLRSGDEHSPQLNLPAVADEQYQRYFLTLCSDMVSLFSAHDFESMHSRDDYRDYEFKLEDLQ